MPNLLTVGLVGAVSDAVGRHRALMLPLLTGGASCLALAVVPTGRVCAGGLCVADGFWALLAATALLSCGGGQVSTALSDPNSNAVQR